MSSQATFSQFNFHKNLNLALTQMGYTTPTPVQAQTIPLALEGRDLLVTAQTGTGKTAAFAVPLLAKIHKGSKSSSLILAPTRELAEQIHKVINQLLVTSPHLKSALVIGGTSFSHQIQALRAKPAFVIGTPGRIIDLIKQDIMKPGQFGTLVIDEADRLLDMGFEPQLLEIVARLPSERQTLLFSATLPDEIEELARRYMKNPARVSVGAVSKPVEAIEQQVVECTIPEKPDVLVREIDKIAGTIIVFTRTRDKAELVTRILSSAGHEVAFLHGDLSQSQRSKTVEGFRNGKFRILVATDIAARGLDIPHIRHVVNYDLPQSPEDYVHRIGRTARAGAEGGALTFVTPQDKPFWGRIHKLIYGHSPKQESQEERDAARKFRPAAPSLESSQLNRAERRAAKFKKQGFRKPKFDPHAGWTTKKENGSVRARPMATSAKKPTNKLRTKSEAELFGDSPKAKPHSGLPDNSSRKNESSSRKATGGGSNRPARGHSSKPRKNWPT